jgi:hypothetical protein
VAQTPACSKSNWIITTDPATEIPARADCYASGMDSESIDVTVKPPVLSTRAIAWWPSLVTKTGHNCSAN